MAKEEERKSRDERRSAPSGGELQRPVFLSVPEAAKLCGVSRNTVYAWVRNEKLPAYQTPGRTNLIRPAELVNFMHQNAMFVSPELGAMARRDEMQSPSSTRTTPGPDQGFAILVADDDPNTRSLCVRAIHDKYRVYQAESGYEALHLLTMHKEIKVVLLDMRMPGLHGSATLSEIEQIRRDVSVIIVTGYVPDIPEVTRNSPQVHRIIEKPFTINGLREAVDEVAAPFREPAK